MAEGVEILCVGTELLLGDILNGNARWIAQQLAALGQPHYRQMVVGDNTERLIAAVQEASQRSSILVTTGGLGPTPDDLTTGALAAQSGGLGPRHDLVTAAGIHDPHLPRGPLGNEGHVACHGRALAPGERWPPWCLSQSRSAFHGRG